MKQSEALYVVFSATPTVMGRLIRLTTRHGYNHVSLSLEEDIHKLYSFARYHQTIPLYGGFVEESILRYATFAGQAKVKICRLPLEEPQRTYLANYLERLWTDRGEYIYNTPAALASLVKYPLVLPKAHTCVSFVADILERYHLIPHQQGRCPSVEELEGLLTPHMIYEGPVPLPRKKVWGQDSFSAHTSTRYAWYVTARHFGRLAKRALRGSA